MTFVDFRDLDDINSISRMGQEFCRRIDHKLPFSTDQFRTLWTHVLKRQDGFIAMTRVQGQIREAIGVMEYPDPTDGEKIAHVGFWYFSEGSHGLQAGRLFKSVFEKLRELKIKRVYCDALFNARFQKVSKYLMAHKMAPVAMQFMLTL